MTAFEESLLGNPEERVDWLVNWNESYQIGARVHAVKRIAGKEASDRVIKAHEALAICRTCRWEGLEPIFGHMQRPSVTA